MFVLRKAIQNKYRGSKSAFKRGYQDLIGMDFFETNGKDINKYNLIDRINLFYKHHENVKFSEDEKVWVKKVGECVTEKDVLDVAEELHAYIKDNKESQGENEDNSSKMLAPDMDSGEDSEQEGKMIYSGMQFSDDEGDTEESDGKSQLRVLIVLKVMVKKKKQKLLQVLVEMRKLRKVK